MESARGGVLGNNRPYYNNTENTARRARKHVLLSDLHLHYEMIRGTAQSKAVFQLPGPMNNINT